MTTPPQQPNLLDTLKAFLRALQADSPPYCLIGALALGAWGRARATDDLDFLMAINDDVVDNMLRVLEPHGFTVDTRWADQNPLLKGQVMRLRHTVYPVDLISPRDAHDREALVRRVYVSLGDLSVWVTSAEDLILLKLKASRDYDFGDARSVVGRQRDTLDLDYLWSWADRLGLQGELHYVLQAAGPRS